jgi:hypothetical protein
MTLSFADIDSQHVELLPGRTVMSMFIFSGKGDINGKGGSGGSGKGGTVSCLISLGNLPLGLGALLGSGAADGSGTSCSSFGTGGGGGAGVSSTK